MLELQCKTEGMKEGKQKYIERRENMVNLGLLAVAFLGIIKLKIILKVICAPTPPPKAPNSIFVLSGPIMVLSHTFFLLLLCSPYLGGKQKHVV